MAPFQTVIPLEYRFLRGPEEGILRVDVPVPKENNESFPEYRRHLPPLRPALAQTVRVFRFEFGKGIPARIGGDSDTNLRLRLEQKEAVDELRPGGVAV